MRHSILCVDDEIDNVDALERIFRKKYGVLKATSGDEGLEILAKNEVALIISDQRMPGMTGIEFLEKSIKSHPDAIRILLTGYTDIESVVGAINTGQVYRYITKPWDPVDLSNTIDKALEKYDLTLELREKNEALQKALDELRTLDDSKNHFMVLINHELKTPLTVILSFLELIKDTPLTSEQEKYLEKVSNSSIKLMRIIEDVLELVSAETGLMKIHLAQVSTDVLFENIEKKFEKGLEEKSLKLQLKIDGGKVKGDRKALRSIIERLTDNAVKFGTAKSTISITMKKEGQGYRFSFENSGKTLSPSVIDKILKPFTLDENFMNHSQGLGLGLSLCQALLRTHDSTLEFKSKNSKVNVSFFLPD